MLPPHPFTTTFGPCHEETSFCSRRRDSNVTPGHYVNAQRLAREPLCVVQGTAAGTVQCWVPVSCLLEHELGVVAQAHRCSPGCATRSNGCVIQQGIASLWVLWLSCFPRTLAWFAR